MIRRLLLGAAAIAGLAACNPSQTEPSPQPGASQPAPPAPTAPVVGDNVLTPEGLGVLRIGMMRAALDAAAGPDAQPEAVGGPDPEACDMYHPSRAPDGVLIMVEGGVLTSIWLRRASSVQTADGVGLGYDGEQLKAKYGASATSTPHKYEDPPSAYLTKWSGAARPAGAYVQDPAARGLVFEIGGDGKVKSIAAGGPSIQYVEGCA